MKRIQKLKHPTPGLVAYLIWAENGVSWQEFYDHNASASYQELVKTLMDLQHGLCGYCEIDLRNVDRQIEHVIPRSDPNRGAAHALAAANLIVCCRGGELRSLFGPAGRNDEERFFPPLSNNRSCGQAKEDNADPEFVDPRTLPALPSLTRVLPNGKIEADTDACNIHNIATTRVEKTIDILGLNVRRLRLAREKRWNALNEVWAIHFGDSTVIERAARGELLQNNDGNLPKFFTTSRSYFSSVGESVLAECPEDWI